MQPRVQRLLPLRLITTQSVGGERRSAILELLPLHRGGVRQIGGKGWWLRGQSTSESDFTKRGNHKNAPIAEVVLNPLNGKDRFSVV
ncbi:MAG: hypothetical protein Q7T74_04375 [Candidatus Saccharibacteria bacterium]|nr:hypothetical protein [Candidatus Saccharibacteria bacterium]